MTKDHIIDSVRKALAEMKETLFAYLHGSFLEGGAFRDIDIGVYTSCKVDTLKYESDVSFAMSEKIGYPVEVRIINDAPVAFQMAVLRKGAVLKDTDREIRTDFIEDVGRRYREYGHFRNILLYGRV